MKYLKKSNASEIYSRKAKDSFKAKWNLFVFKKAIENENSFFNKQFNDFAIDDEIVKTYTTEYWQKETIEKIGNLTIDEIYKKILNFEEENKKLKEEIEKEYVEIFKVKFPFDQFKNLVNADHCEYCGINDELLGKLFEKKKINKKNLRGWKLEVDRKKPNHEYTKENCVMACYWCNNAKTDEFSHEEFIPIGKEIEKIWQKRLNEK